jgi:hypothetical protein
MFHKKLAAGLLCALAVTPALLSLPIRPQEPGAETEKAELRLKVVSSSPGSHRVVPAVIWITPIEGTSVAPFLPQSHYRLLQRNRMFTPHLLVIPVGSVVDFPNADPFFHNVFSLFDGKRFDLGLYEAGSSKSVVFSREGVSYIFCNIHPEMSAVVLALSTPLYAIADGTDSFVIRDVPPGQYMLHVWIEGLPPATLAGLSRSVRVSSHKLDLGTVSAPIGISGDRQHTNKFGNAYDTKPQSSY